MLFQVSSTNFITTPGVLEYPNWWLNGYPMTHWCSAFISSRFYAGALGDLAYSIYDSLQIALRPSVATLKCEELQTRRKLAGGLNGLNYFLFFNHTWDVWLRRPRFFDMFGMDWSYQQKDGPGDMNVRKPGPHCKWCLGNGSPPKMSNRFLAVVDILPSGKHSELDNLHV